MLETVFKSSGHLFTDVHVVHIPLLYCPRVLNYICVWNIYAACMYESKIVYNSKK